MRQSLQHAGRIERAKIGSLRKAAIGITCQHEREPVAAAALQIVHREGLRLRRIEMVQAIGEINFVLSTDDARTTARQQLRRTLRAGTIKRMFLLRHRPLGR